MGERFKLAPTQEFLKRETSGSPIAAVQELIWNALDANAKQVVVKLVENEMFGLSEIEVVDDGMGFTRDLAQKHMVKIGESWKVKGERTPEGRLLHGWRGQGRLIAANVGTSVTWWSTYQAADGLKEVTVTQHASGEGDLGDELPATSKKTGTVARIQGIHNSIPSLSPSRALPELIENFALYLITYPEVRIQYDDELIQVDELVAKTHEQPFDFRRKKCRLKVIEWAKPVNGRRLYLCAGNGMPLDSANLQKVKAPNFEFTAYLCSDWLRQWADEQQLIELNPDFAELLNLATEHLKTYFKERREEENANLEAKWREEQTYPFEGEARTNTEAIERGVFNMAAARIEKEFYAGKDDDSTKKMVFKLLKTTIDRSPREAFRIISEVLDLPNTVLKQFNNVLDKVPLANVVKAASIIAERKTAIETLKALVFDHSATTGEKRDLHKFLESESWVFGDQYALLSSETGLTKVLNLHIDKLRPSEAKPTTKAKGKIKVETSTGKIQRTDLLFEKARKLGPRRYEYLVVELKRPDLVGSGITMNQIEEYAQTVADDQRFHGRDIQWTFILVCNTFDKTAENRRKQKHRPPGLLSEYESNNVTVWAKSWAQIIEECSEKIDFLNEHLEVSPATANVRDYLESRQVLGPLAHMASAEDSQEARPAPKPKKPPKRKPVGMT